VRRQTHGRVRARRSPDRSLPMKERTMVVEETRALRMDAAHVATLEPGELYRAALVPIRDRISIYDDPERFLEVFTATHEPQALLFAADWCQSEVHNGGLHQFFLNATGILAPEAERAFRFLDIAEAADVLAAAMRLFGPEYPRRHDARVAHLRRLERPGES